MGSHEKTQGGKATDKQHQEHGRHQPQPLLDKVADRRPEPVEEAADEEEPQSAREDAGKQKDGNVELRNAAGDGDHLVGERGHAEKEDDQSAVLVIGACKLLELLSIAVKL